MLNEIYLYSIGLVITFNFLTILESTSIKVYIINFILFLNKKNVELYTLEDAEDYVGINWGKVGTLICCPLCYTTHISWIVALCMYYSINSSLYLCIIGSLSWPSISYAFYKKFINN